MPGVISISNLTKTYASGQHALKNVSLDIRPGEIFALLGPNGAGKTTLISIVCGIVRATSGTVLVDGHDIQKDFRAARERIGLVPQELAIEAFETVKAAAAFSRGLFGRARDPAYVERVLRDLSLWDRRDDILMTLSGGMKRRVMIAKALAHEPRILFLDEPTAGVDVELRRDMWALVRRLRDQGVTIIRRRITDEAEGRWPTGSGVVNHGELVVGGKGRAHEEARQAGAHELGALAAPRWSSANGSSRSTPTAASKFTFDAAREQSNCAVPPQARAARHHTATIRGRVRSGDLVSLVGRKARP
jgi:ABC-2 type transport system ATP-binding protein